MRNSPIDRWIHSSSNWATFSLIRLSTRLLAMYTAPTVIPRPRPLPPCRACPTAVCQKACQVAVFEGGPNLLGRVRRATASGIPDPRRPTRPSGAGCSSSQACTAESPDSPGHPLLCLEKGVQSVAGHGEEPAPKRALAGIIVQPDDRARDRPQEPLASGRPHRSPGGRAGVPFRTPKERRSPRTAPRPADRE